MPSTRSDVERLVQKIVRTADWTVEDVGPDGYEVYPPNGTTPIEIPRLTSAGPGGISMQALREKLRRAGWSEDLFRRQEALRENKLLSLPQEEASKRLAELDEQERTRAEAEEVARKIATMNEDNVFEIKGTGITMRLELITPEIAEEYLQYNTDQPGEEGERHQRQLYARTVQGLSEEQSRGEWQLTHQGIAFYEKDSNGVAYLADGQHRLVAVVNSGTSVPMLVTRGMGQAAKSGIDRGRQRSSNDFWYMKNETANRPVLIGLIRYAYLWRNVDQAKWGGHPPLSPRQQEEVLTAHPEIREAVPRGDALRRQVSISATGAAMGCWLIYNANRDEASRQLADEFFAKLASGANISGKDPILTLRNYLQNKMTRRSQIQKKMVPVFHAYLLVQGWNAWARQEQRATVAYKPNNIRVATPVNASEARSVKS